MSPPSLQSGHDQQEAGAVDDGGDVTGGLNYSRAGKRQSALGAVGRHSNPVIVSHLTVASTLLNTAWSQLLPLPLVLTPLTHP